MQETILKRFENPDEVRVFDKGRFEIVHIGGMTIGRASYEPGWKWSQHVAPSVGTLLCEVEHVGLVVSGRAVAAFANGTQMELTPGNWERAKALFETVLEQPPAERSAPLRHRCASSARSAIGSAARTPRIATPA